MDQGSREQIRQRLAQWSLAEARSREARRQPARLSPEQSFRAFEELMALASDCLWAEDPVRKREVEQARRAWLRLRSKLTRP